MKRKVSGILILVILFVFVMSVSAFAATSTFTGSNTVGYYKYHYVYITGQPNFNISMTWSGTGTGYVNLYNPAGTLVARTSPTTNSSPQALTYNATTGYAGKSWYRAIDTAPWAESVSDNICSVGGEDFIGGAGYSHGLAARSVAVFISK